MINTAQHRLWDEFLRVWPLERLSTMTLPEYTERWGRTTLTWWLETRTQDLGSIHGMTSFKFGIYARNDTTAKPPARGRTWGPDYAWNDHLGSTPEEVFKNVKSTVAGIAKSAREGNFALIDNIKFTSMVRWKIAFLYQDRANPQVVPIFNEWWLGRCYERLLNKPPTSCSEMHAALSARLSHLDVFERMEVLLAILKGEKPSPRYWLFTPDAQFSAVARAPVASTFDLPVSDLKPLQQPVVGDRIALVAGADIVSRGEITVSTADEVCWRQEPIRLRLTNFTPPASGIKQLTDTDIQKAILAASAPPPPPAWRGPTHNILLYGPPGTGKTWSTIGRAITLCGEPEPAPAERHATFQRLQQEGRICFVTFHQSFSYEEFVEGIRPHRVDGQIQLGVVDGIFKQLCARASEPHRQHLGHVLIMDEINRGNISRIFGELITLIEPDKRAGAANSLQVTLPCSREPFTIPPNLHLLGTLNTADRSIAMIDVALRRRFRFEKIPFNQEIIRAVLTERGVNPDLVEAIHRMICWINLRLMALKDDDHQIGHALLLDIGLDEEGRPAPAQAADHLKDALKTRILPLLHEYFHREPERVSRVLGYPRDESGKPLRTLPADVQPILSLVYINKKKVFQANIEDDDDCLHFSKNCLFFEADEATLIRYLNWLFPSIKDISF